MTYDCLTPPGSIYINFHGCHARHIIKRDKCQLQYIGETAQ